jgi:RNA polymerase sigma-70 factor (ECF subfamily)
MTAMSWRSRSAGASPTSAGQPTGDAPDSPPAFAGWVGEHVARMGLLAGRLAPAADRDDVVQEALLRAWRSRRSFDPAKGSPGTWLLTIVANVARQERGRRGRTAMPAEVPDSASVPAGLGPEVAIDLARAVDTLAARQRLAVDCFYFVGLTVVETAAVMGCSDGTVKSTLADARARLRVLMEDHHEH